MKANILTTEEKKYLRVISRMIQSYGKKTAYIRFDYDHGIENFEIKDLSLEHQTEFDNENIPIPPELLEIIKKCFLFVQENSSSYEIDVEDISYGSIEFEIDAINKTISIDYNYYYYDTSEASSEQFSAEEEGERVEKIFETLSEISDETEFELFYSGGGDSGYIESEFRNNDRVPADIEDWCYGVLENLHGGWEINEGSSGNFYFNTEDKTITLNHTYNTEVNETKNLFSTKF